MNKLPSKLPIVAVAAALLATGCGGSEVAPLSKAEFIKQGDAICAKTDKTQATDYHAYAKKHERTMTIEGIITLITLPSILKEAEELNALGAPSGDGEKIATIVAGIEEAVGEAEKAVEKDPNSFEAPFAKVNRLAHEYGFKACSEVI